MSLSKKIGFKIDKKFVELTFSGALILNLMSCGSPDHLGYQRFQIEIPIVVKYNPQQRIALTNNSASQYSSTSELDLSAIPSDIVLSVDKCGGGASNGGYNLSTSSSKPLGLNLYADNPNCIVKLIDFKIGNTTYAAAGPNAIPFTTWQVGDVAVFQNVDGSMDLVQVTVMSQVSTSGVDSNDAVAYEYVGLTSTTTVTNTAGQGQAGANVMVTASGEAIPNFSIADARFLNVNPNGSANLAFSLECGVPMTGDSVDTYTCDSQVLQSELDYVLVPDIYSHGSLQVSEANAAFSQYTPHSIASLIVPPGGLDLESNVLQNGGFYTSEVTPLVTGANPITHGGLNNVLIIRHKDIASGLARSYRYFYVEIPSLPQQ